VEEATNEQARQIVRQLTLHIERDNKLSIAKKGLGVPSPPGTPPHRQTGHLVSSYGHEFHDSGLLGIHGTNLRYARYLELGTSKMAARPHLRPAFDRIVKDWQKRVKIKAF